jgi:hypothetical protein
MKNNNGNGVEEEEGKEETASRRAGTSQSGESSPHSKFGNGSPHLPSAGRLQISGFAGRGVPGQSAWEHKIRTYGDWR